MGQDLFLRKSTVMGGGLMGSQITLVLALGSSETVLMSRRQETVDKAMDNIRRYAADLERHDQLRGETAAAVTNRIRTSTDVEDAVSDAEFVVESISENLEGKQALFEQMDALAPPETVLASNTSGLPITILGERMVHQDRIGGSHFVQPGHIVPVVEVIRGDKTSDATMDRSCEVWERLGRITLRVAQGWPRFSDQSPAACHHSRGRAPAGHGCGGRQVHRPGRRTRAVPAVHDSRTAQAARHQWPQDARERGHAPVEGTGWLGRAACLPASHGRAG